MSYKWRVMIATVLGISMFLIDTTVVNVALAKLQGVFSIDVSTVQWVITGYALASGVATPLAGYSTARWGTKRVWILGLVVFASASMLCGLSLSFPILILGRVLQGFAGGMLLPLGSSQIFAAFPAGERGAAFGLIAVPIVAGPTLGPTLGGYLVTNVDWRFVFFINLPVAIVAVTLGTLWLRDERAHTRPRLDIWGTVLSIVGFGSMLFGLSRAGVDGWGSPKVIGLVGGGGLCLLGFVINELIVDEPLMEMRLFAIPQFLIANVVGWVSTVALFGAEFLLPLYLQNLRGISAFQTGVFLIPMGLTAGFISPIAGRLQDRLGARIVVLVGFILLTVNTYSLSLLTVTTSFHTLTLLLVLRGAGLAFALQPTQLAALAVVPNRLLTNASSLNTAMRNVWQSFGVALLGTIVQSQTATNVALLSQEITPTSWSGQFFYRISQLIQTTGNVSASTANTEAAMLILGQIRIQASALAFGAAYRYTFYGALLAIVLALFLPGRQKTNIDPSVVAASH